MAVTSETIERFRQLPHTVARLRSEVLAAPTVDDAENALNTFLESTNYDLPLRQLGVFGSGIENFYRHKAGIEFITTKSKIGGIKRKLSKRLGQHVNEITQVSVHPTSLTFALTDRAHERVWQNRAPGERQPHGFTSPDFRLPFANETIAYSFRNAQASDESVAEHENEHVIYKYTHPDRLNSIPSNASLTESTQEAYVAQDKVAFKKQLDELSRYDLATYLDELHASSLTRDGVYNQFFGYYDYYYKRKRLERFASLRQGLPEDIFERLGWEKMIWDEDQKTRHKMLFIEQEYRKLAGSDMPTEELQNIIHALIPQQAYMIRLFTPGNAEAEPQDVYRWAREYFNGWGPQRLEGRINDATEFLMTTLALYDYPALSPTEDMLQSELDARRRHFIYGDDDAYHEEEYVNITDKIFTEDSIEKLVGLISSVYQDKLEKIRKLASVPFSELGLTPEEEEAVREQVINRSLNLANVFSGMFSDAAQHIDSFKSSEFDRIKNDPELQNTYIKSQNLLLAQFARRSLQMHDASVTLLKAVRKNEDVDFEQLFSPGYRRPDETYERDIAKLTSSNDEGVVITQILTSLVSPESLGIREHEKTIYLIADSYYRKIAENLIRILYWAKETNRTGDDIDLLKESLAKLKDYKQIPQKYFAFLQAEELIPLDEQDQSIHPPSQVLEIVLDM